jgi:hypothetical protein
MQGCWRSLIVAGALLILLQPWRSPALRRHLRQTTGRWEKSLGNWLASIDNRSAMPGRAALPALGGDHMIKA